ncbi:hypothetical protein KAU08_09085 [bacterium]|nr:hypothetical protein [bacterium]
MIRNFFILFVVSTAIFLMIPGTALALDEDSESLQFLPPDAPMVMAVDVDEFMQYVNRLERGWRDADTAHLMEGLSTVSNLFSRDELKPDFLTFFNRLSGVQALTMEPGSEIPFMVLAGGDDVDGKIMTNYLVTYILERQTYDNLMTLMFALEDYKYEMDEESEEYLHYGYPADIYDLVEFGYIEEIPINPYTGEPVMFLEPESEESLGDMIYEAGSYEALTNCYPTPDDEAKKDDEIDEGAFDMYRIIGFSIGGVNISPGWANNFKSYPDLADRLLNFGDEYDYVDCGFNVETEGEWLYLSRDDKDFSIAAGGQYLLVSASLDSLYDGVERFEARSGFAFDTPDNFDTDGAIMRWQTDPAAMFDECGATCLTGGELPPEVAPMLDQIFENIGMEAIDLQHDAVWLRNHDLEMVRHVELTGEADRSLIGSLVNAEPKELMTAQDGPLDIIGEIAWANPDEFAHAYIDFIFDMILPMVAEESGVDPQVMLGMVGLGDINNLEFGEEAYIFITGSEERANGMYVPGISAAIRTDNPDIGYAIIGLVDTLTFFMGMEAPFYQEETGDDTVFTWIMDSEKCPASPTIAIGDGWVIKGLFQDDVLTIRDALENGEMLSPDGLDPANMRMRVNRQALLRGIADVMYVLPDGAAAAGSILEILAQLSDDDERLYTEVVSTDEYLESHSYLSIDLFENMVPVLSYIMKAIDELE